MVRGEIIRQIRDRVITLTILWVLFHDLVSEAQIKLLVNSFCWSDSSRFLSDFADIHFRVRLGWNVGCVLGLPASCWSYRLSSRRKLVRFFLPHFVQLCFNLPIQELAMANEFFEVRYNFTSRLNSFTQLQLKSLILVFFIEDFIIDFGEVSVTSLNLYVLELWVNLVFWECFPVRRCFWRAV